MSARCFFKNVKPTLDSLLLSIFLGLIIHNGTQY